MNSEWSSHKKSKRLNLEAFLCLRNKKVFPIKRVCFRHFLLRPWNDTAPASRTRLNKHRLCSCTDCSHASLRPCHTCSQSQCFSFSNIGSYQVTGLHWPKTYRAKTYQKQTRHTEKSKTKHTNTNLLPPEHPDKTYHTIQATLNFSKAKHTTRNLLTANAGLVRRERDAIRAGEAFGKHIVLLRLPAVIFQVAFLGKQSHLTHSCPTDDEFPFLGNNPWTQAREGLGIPLGAKGRSKHHQYL